MSIVISHLSLVIHRVYVKEDENFIDDDSDDIRIVCVCAAGC